ncbi:class I SAM-dependent methyltransferase [Streptomyces sp. TBY4]|uniref:class I SAM-dependent methyltransferase n=1 Tax=Streptomyces sp. TBY4 TaxID=2962030 RepID=UPI0020B719F6|nr:class I SAM-dependent methyltransferase [Streptomyces sp. TBY4]MCP3756990.1 methyltransferase domain-containing protein [Streptomyces sp. TBY4]
MRRAYRTLYRLGIVPWDTTGVPAPLVDIVEGHSTLPPAQAVDLGCGTGRQARYLAEHGWQVTAVDYTPEAISAARHKDPRGQVLWRVADATEPQEVDPDGHLSGATSLLLDNGCLHGIPAVRRLGWAVTVNILAAPGAVLLVRAAPPQHRGVGPRGISAGEITALLGDRWQQAEAPAAGWYRYTRTEST